jgi:hypothetical protein
MRRSISALLTAATVAALPLVGVGASTAQALPNKCAPERYQSFYNFVVTCTGGTGFFRVWVDCWVSNDKPPVRVYGAWTPTDSTSAAGCTMGQNGPAVKGGWDVSDVILGPPPEN